MISACLLVLVATAFQDGSKATERRVEVFPNDVTVRSLDGGLIPLKSREKETLVLVFLWSECPISNRYVPTLNALTRDWTKQGVPVRLIGIFVDPDSEMDTLKKHVHQYEIGFRMGWDENGEVARLLGLEKVPSAVVVDADGRVRYRGRINNQFHALGKTRSGAVRHDLSEAVHAVLRGGEVAEPETVVVGCTLPRP